MFFVYCYYNPLKMENNQPQPFYVGKGKNKRYLAHMFESSLVRGPNKHKANTIKSILVAGQQPIIEILSTHENEEDAFIAERRAISQIGRADLGLGPLTNMTDGGEGTSNKVFTPEYRKKLSDGTRRAHACGKLDANTMAFKYSQLGKHQTPEHIAARTAARAGYTHNVETRQKISDSNRLARQTDLWKERASLAQKGKKHTAEHTLKSIIGNPKTQPITVDGVQYVSLNQASKATGISRPRLKKRL